MSEEKNVTSEEKSKATPQSAVSQSAVNTNQTSNGATYNQQMPNNGGMYGQQMSNNGGMYNQQMSNNRGMYNQQMPNGGMYGQQVPNGTTFTQQVPNGTTFTQQKTSYTVPSAYKPIGAWGYLGWQLLFALPIAGWILLIVFACGASSNKNLTNFARSYFCWLLLVIIIAVVLGVLAAAGIFAFNGFLQSL